MKFAKELSQRATPEWAPFYLNYRGAKKGVSSVSEAAAKVPRRASGGESSSRSLRLQRSLHRAQTSQSELPLLPPNTSSDEWKAFRLRELEFLDFLDRELAKVDHFYAERERGAHQDIQALRRQLEIYRSHSTGDVHNTALRRLGDWEPDAARRDYSRRDHAEVPLHYAKRQLKDALAETYRGLDMIRTFTLDNREAFRKAIKKLDKNVVPYTGVQSDYMDKVKKAHFVKSQEMQILMDETEDLYAEYFEDNNRKIAAKKLRAKTKGSGAFTGASVRASGLTIAGTIFGIQGLVEGILDIKRRPDLKTDTEYVLQLYGGLFLPILLAMLFALCARTFEHNKVNYQFVFEIDKRSALAWQQLLEIPSWFLLILGVCMYLNLALKVGGTAMYVYWPLIAVFVTVLAYLLPGVPYARSRMWLLASFLRMCLSGIFRVSFGEFFLGDLMCSLTYTMGNIELFPCLYIRDWNEPQYCNSSHSRLLGFFSALPGIWRALQCLRRAGPPWSKKFAPNPHLYNFGKYCFTISQYVLLSIYRIDRSTPSLVLFCVFAGINSIYCICWDIVYDWSLGTDYRKSVFPLREITVYKSHWIYYVAMPVDVIIRCNWIPYAIWTKDAQHSSFVSFMVALSEVFRRAMWVLIRLENEQATNTASAIAFKIRRLPYHVETPRPSESDQGPPSNVDGLVESATSERPMNTLQRLGSEIRQAHASDYERKRPTGWDNDSEDDEE